jgi:hypothetical protein
VSGTAHVLIAPTLLEVLREHYTETVTIMREVDFGDGLYSVLLSSTLLRAGYHGCVAIIVEEGFVRFGADADT